MDVTAALIVGLTLMGAKFFDWWASTQLARPIFCVAILGALLGHPTEGIILAAQLELVFIGNVSLGGVMRHYHGLDLWRCVRHPAGSGYRGRHDARYSSVRLGYAALLLHEGCRDLACS